MEVKVSTTSCVIIVRCCIFLIFSVYLDWKIPEAEILLVCKSNRTMIRKMMLHKVH